MPEPQDRPSEGARSAPPPHRRAHQTARDLERYADLFAQRTRVMRSSAMRDPMLDADGYPEVLEANAIPGLTDTSLLPMAAHAAGLEFEDLVARIVELALEHHGVAASRSST